MASFGSLEYTITAFEQHLKEGDAAVYNADKMVRPKFSLEGEMATEATQWKIERAFISQEIAYYKGLMRLNHAS